MHDRIWTLSGVALLATSLAMPGLVLAQGASKQDVAKAAPANAQARQYGSGWDCKPGFRLDAAVCAAIKLPENAFLTDDSYGPGWTCKRGYKPEGNGCVTVK